MGPNKILFWRQIQLSTSDSSPQSAIFGLTGLTDNFSLINYLLLIFKFYNYIVNKKNQGNILQPKSLINKIKDFELKISKNEPGNY